MINSPGGKNVYPGQAAIDYNGTDVTPETFYNVLLA